MSTSTLRVKDSSQVAALKRGSACVSCRRRKMKCDGQRPVCGPCSRAERPDDCEYIHGQERSTIQILEQNISDLETRLQELQNPGSMDHAQSSVEQQFDFEPMDTTHDDLSSQAPPAIARPTGEDATQNLADSLRSNFMPYATEFGFFLNVPRFCASFFQPGQPSGPASCLKFALYLWAIRLSSGPGVQLLEKSYVERAIQEAAVALSGNHPQKVMHSIQAEVLLAVYFFSLGRSIEGKFHVANAVATALSAGLHKIRSAGFAFSSDVVPPPSDAIEEGERILAAWTVFNLDKSWAVALDSPPNFQHQSKSPAMHIDTPWPLETEEFEQGRLPEHLRTSDTVNKYLARTEGDDSRHSLRALETKAIILWDRAADFVNRYSPGMENDVLTPILKDFKIAYVLIDVEIDALPPVPAPTMSASGVCLPLTENARRLLLIHSILGAAAIHIHTAFSKSGLCAGSKIRRINGAKRIFESLLIARGAGPVNQRTIGRLNPIIGATWIEASRVLLEEIKTSQSTGTDVVPLTTLIQRAIGAMTDFGHSIPLMGFQAQAIQELFLSA